MHCMLYVVRVPSLSRRSSIPRGRRWAGIPPLEFALVFVYTNISQAASSAFLSNSISSPLCCFASGLAFHGGWYLLTPHPSSLLSPVESPLFEADSQRALCIG